MKMSEQVEVSGEDGTDVYVRVILPQKGTI